ncbi:MAG TPA: hypothetical protein DCR14_06915, partial [Acidimicrobiaceae bacterium]|nr:hypothetical protein [Acidimicrobiaceae bacterium]
MIRPLRVVARALAAAGLFGVLAAVPVVVLATIGVPAPSWEQLRAAWSGGRIDDELVLRLGAAVFTVLWMWFAVTAVAELWRVLQWQRNGRRRPLRPVGPGVTGWVQSLVRFVAVSSVSAGVALGSIASVASAAPSASTAGVDAMRPVASSLQADRVDRI